MDQYPNKNNIELKILCVVGTQETSVHINRDRPFQSSGIQSRLKWQENSNADGEKETQYLYGNSRANGQKDKTAAKMEVRGSRQKKGMQDRQGLKEKKRKSAKIALFFLYGFLDAEKHGGEPLVQP